jgi:hypothetical protein
LTFLDFGICGAKLDLRAESFSSDSRIPIYLCLDDHFFENSPRLSIDSSSHAFLRLM